LIYLWLNTEDGSNDNPLLEIPGQHDLSEYLQSLSTYARFLRFANDFRREEGYQLHYDMIRTDKAYIKLSLKDACEFLSRKDYTDNWQSEMHETFCYWDFEEWKRQMQEANFSIHPLSCAFTNSWIVKNRWEGSVALYDLNLHPIDFPVTTMLLVGIKQ
jgi:hypothetical protein